MWIYLFLQLGGFRVKSRLITFNNERSQLIFLFDNFVYFFLKKSIKKREGKRWICQENQKNMTESYFETSRVFELKILKDLFKARE